MTPRTKRRRRDIEQHYPVARFVARLRRLADCLERGRGFRIRIAGERVAVPPGATLGIEHERSASSEEIEFQLEWRLDR